MVKMAVFAPIPSVNATMARSVKTGLRTNIRNA